jgi:hypothetical protein
LCKKITVAKSKEVKRELPNSQERQVWQNILWKAVAQEGLFFNDDNDDDEYSSSH